MKPATVFVIVSTRHQRADKDNKPYLCVSNRVYQSEADCIRDAEHYTLGNTGTIATILGYDFAKGLTVEASYVMGRPDIHHTIGVRDCISVYEECVLQPITSYLDTICRANAEIGGHNV